MSAVDKYMKMIEEDEKQASQPSQTTMRPSFQELRTELVEYLRTHMWIMRKECEYLNNRTSAQNKENFDEKGKGWTMIIKGAEIITNKY